MDQMDLFDETEQEYKPSREEFAENRGKVDDYLAMRAVQREEREGTTARYRAMSKPPVLAAPYGSPQNVLRDLPENAEDRKAIPVGTGVLDYFPAALAEVSRVSKAGNDQHNPGQPLHWARGKSADHWDCIIRHGIQRGTRDTDGLRHTAKLAWRALAMLQEELEAEAGFNPLMQNPYHDEPTALGSYTGPVRVRDDGSLEAKDE